MFSITPLKLPVNEKTSPPSLSRGQSKADVLPEIEMTSMQEINRAWERVVGGDVKYRFVIDMATLKGEKKTA
ncbi:MAG: hypothetical protein ABI787_10300 [Spartobacteria bacterium]